MLGKNMLRITVVKMITVKNGTDYCYPIFKGGLMYDILIKEMAQVHPLKFVHFVKNLSKSSHLTCSVTKDIPKNCAIFTGKYLRWS